MPGAHLSKHGLHAETLSSVDQAAMSEAAISLFSASFGPKPVQASGGRVQWWEALSDLPISPLLTPQGGVFRLAAVGLGQVRAFTLCCGTDRMVVTFLAPEILNAVSQSLEPRSFLTMVHSSFQLKERFLDDAELLDLAQATD